MAVYTVRGTVLRDGDLLTGEDKRVIRVVAACENVYMVHCATPLILTLCAYHLGNRHAQVEIGDGFLRIRVDPVLKLMLEGLGARVELVDAAFEPESGAYGGARVNASALLHLLQFASPALPIGGYSYSQGLEAALDAGIVHDAGSARTWISSCLHEVMAQWDAPLFWRLLKAFETGDSASVDLWSERFLASRDSAEFRAETVQMGYSLGRLLAELGIADVAGEAGRPTAFARAVDALVIPHQEALLAMLFSWAENQVLVCVESVPLGQVAGQRMLLSLRPDIEQAARHAMALEDDAMSNWSPGLSILSMRHEAQHGRLYRS